MATALNFESLRIWDLLEFAPIGIILVDYDGTIKYVNKCARFFALKTKIEGNKLLSCFPYLARFNPKKEMFAKVELKSNLYYIRVNKININNNQLISFWDETSQKVLQEENCKLHKITALYESMLNSIDEGILAVDKKGKIIFMNRAQENLDNLKFNKIKGSHISKYYDLNENTSLLLQLVKTGNKLSRQPQYYFTRGKHSVNVVTSCTPIFIKNKISGAVSINQDFKVTMELYDRISYLIEKENKDKEQKVKKSKKFSSNGTRYVFDDIVGNSKKLRESIKSAKRAAITPSNILIYGATGTGKELFVQSIHNESEYAKQPLISINCSALPDTLLESILFGTVKGAFTGAVDRPGLFEQASGGTLYLDEINSMPLFLQPKLLRVIQEGCLRRIGGTEEIKVSPRIISSINVNPIEAISKNQIREDLYYRLAVVTVGIPPLQERKDDIPLLTKFFIQMYNKQLNKKVIYVTNEVMDFFMSYHWPGNVRELQHVIEGSMSILESDARYITINDIPKHMIPEKYGQDDNDEPLAQTYCSSKYRLPLLKALEDTEKKEIIKVLKALNGNISRSARQMGMSRQNLQYKIKKYEIDVCLFRH